METIGIVAGEASGDILGSRLMAALLEINPDLSFEGIGGKEMITIGFNSLYPMERLSVMGIAEVLKRLPGLLSIRKQLIRRWTEQPPDLVIGIDAPDFNLGLEARLHDAGVKVAHYVSPSVWAWRSSRVKKMRGKLDLMLTLFPFEVAFYEQHNIPVAFVGHPLADEIIPEKTDIRLARKAFPFLDPEQPVLAVLPGSRSSELNYLAEPFILAMKALAHQSPELQFIVPMVNQQLRQQFEEQLQALAANTDVHLVDGRSREVMAAADWILLASGTAVLEGMLIGRPMVAAGKMSSVTAKIIQWSGTLNIEHFTLPNNLAGKMLVPELIQNEVTVDNIVAEVKNMMAMNIEEREQLLEEYRIQHRRLKQDASQQAARILADTFSLA